MEKITLKRRELIELWAGVEQVGTLIDGKDFRLVYALKRNTDAIRAEVDATNAAQRPSEAYQAFEQERLALAGAYAELDNGAPRRAMREDGSEIFVMDQSRMAEFRAELMKLRSRYRDAVEAEDQRKREIEGKFLLEDVSVEVHRFSGQALQKAVLPGKAITAAQMVWLWPVFSDQDKIIEQAGGEAENAA